MFGSPSSQSNLTRWLSLSFLCLALLVAVGVRVRLLDLPLERDEGEYAYAGQLQLEGIPPYQLACNMKMPGIYLAYAGVMSLFGQTPAGIHLGLLIVHLATLAVLFLIARKLLDFPGAVIATAAYALMTLSPAYFGLAAHATHFVMLPALLGVWMLLRVEQSGRWWGCLVAGFFFGAAFLMKQPGLFFGVFGGLYLAWISLAGKIPRLQIAVRLGLYSLGCLLPFLSVCLWLKIAGVFPEFWFWTISYAREYVSIETLDVGLDNAKLALAALFHAAPLLWLLAGLGLLRLCFASPALNARIFLAGLLLFSGLAVCPGWYFRGHYFILLAPAVALLAGLAVSGSLRQNSTPSAPSWLRWLPFLFGTMACAQSLFADRAVLFFLSPPEASRAVYGANAFPESAEIGRYLAAHTRPDQPIMVIGSEPQIYFYAHRRSSSRQIYTYPLMEPQPFARRMQEDMIREIEQTPPAYVVLVSIPSSWLARTNSCALLFDWMRGYGPAHFQCVGLIQLNAQSEPLAVWGPEAATTPVQWKCYISVFENRPARGPSAPLSRDLD
jgi:hypothetical protein